MTTAALHPEAKAETTGLKGLRQRLDAGNGLLPYGLVAPVLIVILLVAVFPILDAIRLSLLDNPLIASGSDFVGLRNYIQVIGDPQFRGSIFWTIAFSVISVALETFFGLLIALLINASFPGRGLVRAAILIPWAFPTIVSGRIWQLMYNDQTGIVTYILQGLHILKPGSTLLQTNWGILTATVITDVWKTTPFMALLILAGLQVISADLYEAAAVDGSSRWQQFWMITLPLLKNSLLIALLFRALDAIRVFDLFYILAGNQVQTMATYSYNKMFTGTTFDFAPGIAASVILAIFATVVAIIFVYWMGGISRQE
ncbi:MAG TPA: sugar ABC transporter permease [Ktedonobacterales bacterium]|nr:sugar ABC transporter permease [Ktedonobacterales bacterium]